MANEEKKNSAPATPAKAAVPKKSDNKKLGFGQRVSKWFREMKSELKKVVWPSAKTLRNNTLIALGMMVISAVLVWGFDELAQMLVKALFTLAG